MNVKYFINNIEIEPPLNDAELSVELNYDKDDVSSNAISLNEFEFGVGSQIATNDAATLINSHRTGGLGSGVGVFEGLPFRIELSHDGQTVELTSGYLDTSKAIFDCDKVICPYVEKGNIDWLNDVADRNSFAYLYEKTNFLNDSDFIPIPYVLSELPNNREAFMASVSLFLITETITNQLQSLIEYVAGIIVLEVSDIIKIILRIIYIIGLLFTAYKLIKQIINLLIQPVKYHDGMTVKRLCEVGAESFGFTFSSTILDTGKFKNLVIIPNKYNHEVNEKKDNILGFLSPNNAKSMGYYNGTFGELLRALKEMFNAKIIIDGTILRLEREDYNNSAYNYILPPVDQTSYTLNSDELSSNYVVEFATDINDKNTLQRYEGTVTQVTQSADKVTNSDMVLMRGLEKRAIPFARCTRKTELTIPENLMKELAEVIDFFAHQIQAVWDKVIDTFDDLISALKTVLALIGVDLQDGADVLVDLLAEIGITKILGNDIVIDLENLPRIRWNNLGVLVYDRIGMLKMENDFIDVQKIGRFNISDTPRNTKVSTKDETNVNSEVLYDRFHFLRSFVVTDDRPNANQYKRFKVNGIPFCFDDFMLLRNNNYMQDDEGNDCKLTSARWNVRSQIAEIDYEQNKLYTNNIIQEIITPDGK